ncbi:PaaI family thioesterase [Aurantivibrio plasticivorans]
MSEPLKFPFAELIGLNLVRRGDGESECELDISEKHMNPHGIAHGGAVFSLVDTGMGNAVTTLLDDGEMPSTIEIKINYLRPAVEGRVTCQTRVVSKGRRTAVIESRVVDQQGKDVCLALGTFMILSKQN